MSSTSLLLSDDPIYSHGFGESPSYQIPVKTSPFHKTLKRVSLVALGLFLVGMTIVMASRKIGSIAASYIGANPNRLGLIGAAAALVCYLSALVFAAIKLRNQKPPTTDSLQLNADFRGGVAVGKFDDQTSILVARNTLESTSWKYEMISCAEQSIEISGNYCSGEVFRHVLRLIQQLLGKKPKLQVRILANLEVLMQRDRELINLLKYQFPQRFHCLLTHQKVEFSPHIRLVDNHVKIVVVDEKYFVTGGSNLFDGLNTRGDRNVSENDSLKNKIIGRLFPRGGRDMDVVGTGPLAKTMRMEFYKLYAIWEYKMGKTKNTVLLNSYLPIDQLKAVADCPKLETSSLLVRNVPIKLTVGDPTMGYNPCTEEYKRVLLNTSCSLIMGHMFVNPVKSLRSILFKAASHGLDINIITNGYHENIIPNSIFTQQNRHLYFNMMSGAESSGEPLNKPLPKIFEFNKLKGITYHKKVLVSDKRVSIIGTYNLGKKSHYCDYEWILTIDSPEIANQIETVLRHDMLYSTVISWKKARSYHQNSLSYIIGRMIHKILWRIV